VTIAAERRNGFWLFTVEDNGIGIPSELGDDAFAMFKRAHSDDHEGSVGVPAVVTQPQG
jgi:light-regulated signal transduction histidine kinase (bacteriophytochrome)